MFRGTCGGRALGRCPAMTDWTAVRIGQWSGGWYQAPTKPENPAGPIGLQIAGGLEQPRQSTAPPSKFRLLEWTYKWRIHVTELKPEPVQS